MKRFFALLLVLLLPLQMSLAAVLGIEAGAGAVSAMQMQEEIQENAACHQHMAQMDSSAADEMPADTGHAKHGGTCGSCSMNCCSALPIASSLSPVFSTAEAPAFTPVAQQPAPPAARPERPKWGGLA